MTKPVVQVDQILIGLILKRTTSQTIANEVHTFGSLIGIKNFKTRQDQ